MLTRSQADMRKACHAGITLYTEIMKLTDAIARIRSIEPAIRALGAKSLYVFGSTARGDAKPTSDVDIFIDRDPSKHFGVDELFDLEELLEQALNNKVDLGTRTGLHPVLRDEIEQSAIRVF